MTAAENDAINLCLNTSAKGAYQTFPVETEAVGALSSTRRAVGQVVAVEPVVPLRAELTIYVTEHLKWIRYNDST